MRFGMQFFPDIPEAVKPAAQYYDEAMRLVGLCDEYGYSHIRTVSIIFTIGAATAPTRSSF